MGGQNKIKKGCKYEKLFLTSEGFSNFKSMQYEMGKTASIITIKWRTEFKSCLDLQMSFGSNGEHLLLFLCLEQEKKKDRTHSSEG